MRIPDPEALEHAEARLANVQSSLDEVRHMLRAAAQVERTAQKGVGTLRSVVTTAAGSLLILIVVMALRRRHAHDRVDTAQGMNT
jgi:DNA-binding transcriptional LysR family regulator